MRDQLEPLARILLTGYDETFIFSTGFRRVWGEPPTIMNKAHHLRSIVRALVRQSDRYDAVSTYSEFGRIELVDTETGERFLLRSRGAVSVERDTQQQSLFDATSYIASDVLLLVYEFSPKALHLSVTGAYRSPGKAHLIAASEPIPVGSWVLLDQVDAPAFDQDDAESFRELGPDPFAAPGAERFDNLGDIDSAPEVEDGDESEGEGQL